MAPTQPGQATRIREITDAGDSGLKDAYALLTTAFRRAERVPLREWKNSINEKSQRLLADVAWHLLVATRRGKVVGLISGTYLGNVNIGVIGYLTIAHEERSSGIATRLRASLRRRFEKDALRINGRPLNSIAGEVSDENPWLRSLAKRPNVIVLDFPYYQPRLSVRGETIRFHFYLESIVPRRRRIPVSEVKRILYTIWRRIYRVSRPLDSPEFRGMIRALEQRRTVKEFTPE